MKELLLPMARYNIWANKRISDALLKLEEEQLDMHIPSSFPSLRLTVHHLMSAENIWLQRLLLVEQPVWLESGFEGTFSEACGQWLTASEGLAAFTERQFDDKVFRHIFQYYDRKKKSVKLPVSTALQHVFNHSTFHRGQLVTMMRQAGLRKIPGTDLGIFAGLK